MKRKKSIAARLGMAAFALTLVTTCMTGGTLAKYASEVSGTGTAVAAKWSFKAGNTEAGVSDTAFGTFTLASTKTTNANVEATTIAPGDTGKAKAFYEFTDTEVAATVTTYIRIAAADKTNLPKNLEIKLNGTWTKVSTMTADADIEVSSVDLSLADMSDDAKRKGSVDIEWRWAFDEASNTNKDTEDTVNGKTPITGSITVKVKAEQKAVAGS